MGLLTEEDLAYMRATQSEARPSLAELTARVVTRTPTGGVSETWGAPQEVTARIDGSPEEVPDELASRWEGGTAYKITLTESVDVRDGDRLTLSPDEVYEIITDGDPDRWATAQVLYGRRIAFPERAAP